MIGQHRHSTSCRVILSMFKSSRTEYYFCLHKNVSQDYVCMYVYGHTYSKSMDQPGKVANPARGQLNRENEYFSVRVRA